MGQRLLHVRGSDFGAPVVTEIYDPNKDQAHHPSSELMISI